MTTMDEISSLKKQVADLTTEVANLKEAAKPAAPFTAEPHRPTNHLDVLAIPSTVVADMVRAVPDDLMRDIVSDFRRGPSQSSLVTSPNDAEAKVRGTGWQDGKPLGPPSGLDYVDQQVAAQDMRDLHARLKAIVPAAETSERNKK